MSPLAPASEKYLPSSSCLGSPTEFNEAVPIEKAFPREERKGVGLQTTSTEVLDFI